MLILTTSAKTLDFESEIPKLAATQPQFLDKAGMIATILKTKSAEEIKNLMSLGDTLAELNYERIQAWTKTHTQANSRPSLYAYQGDIFSQFQLKEYTREDLHYAQRSLRIISGLYGLVRALDCIQPYRLEMIIDLKKELGKTLVEYWQVPLSDFLNDEIEYKGHSLVLNLASNEYAKAINFDQLNCRVIHVNFKYKRDGIYKTIGFLAKKARGTMIDWCIQNKVESLEELRTFNKENYHLKEESANRLVFVQ